MPCEFGIRRRVACLELSDDESAIHGYKCMNLTQEREEEAKCFVHRIDP